MLISVAFAAGANNGAIKVKPIRILRIESPGQCEEYAFLEAKYLSIVQHNLITGVKPRLLPALQANTHTASRAPLKPGSFR